MEKLTTIAQPGDLALLAGKTHKNFIVRLSPGEKLQTHRGILDHDRVIGQAWGSQVFSHLGNPFYILKPSLGDLLLGMRRATQIMYPKDIGFILVTMGIGPGQHVLEAGTGSGALTIAFAHAVGHQGRVTTYELRQDIQVLARSNLRRLGLDDRVVFKHRDIAEGFDEREVDAIFLDLPRPEDYIGQVRYSLRSGGYFGCILPTANQVSRLLAQLGRYDFAFIEVCELLLRYYKPVSDRFRPTDRMVAHTGYLIFGRPVLPTPDEEYAAEEQPTFPESDDDGGA